MSVIISVNSWYQRICSHVTLRAPNQLTRMHFAQHKSGLWVILEIFRSFRRKSLLVRDQLTSCLRNQFAFLDFLQGIEALLCRLFASLVLQSSWNSQFIPKEQLLSVQLKQGVFKNQLLFQLTSFRATLCKAALI